MTLAKVALNKKMTKRSLMKAAHEMAHQMVQDFGLYTLALSAALKEIWRQVKLYNKTRFGQDAIMTATMRITMGDAMYLPTDVFGVPFWIIEKNLSEGEGYAAKNADSVSVERETEKAALLNFKTAYGIVSMWAPKSVLKGFGF
ncbi:hypothetical protein [Lacticaseibacillus saniviri]